MMSASNASESPREFFSPRPDRDEERIARWEDRHFRKHHRSGGSWWFGGILVQLGAALLLQNLGMSITGNWWALILLIPALGSIESSWAVARSQGRFTSSAMDSLTGGLFFAFVAAMFLYELDW